MSLPLISSLVIGVLLLLGLLNGFRRGGIREGAALIGVLLGALLVELWADRWGQTLHERSGLKIENARWLVGLALLLGAAIVAGYGSGLLIRRGALKSGERITGGLLGLINTALLVSFTLRYTQQLYFNEREPGQIVETWIRNGIASRLMLTWTDLALVGAAALMAVAVVLTAAIRLGRLATQPRPSAKPDKPAPAAGAFGPKPQQPASAGPKPAAGPPAGAAPAPQPKPAGQQEQFLDWPPKGQ